LSTSCGDDMMLFCVVNRCRFGNATKTFLITACWSQVSPLVRDWTQTANVYSFHPIYKLSLWHVHIRILY
jgi:hypothetical protein